jgi:2-polyprenyl-6-methoxyphenol hydroxylase-like FAD-dependent oxidoreductase
MRPSNVAVVGFGIGGSAVASLLADQGHAVTLFERTSTLGPVGAGLILQPSGQRVLARLGLLDEISQRGERLDRIVARSCAGRKIIDLQYADAGADVHGLGVGRIVLHDALRGLVERAGVATVLGAEIVSAEGGVVVDTGGVEWGGYDLVVAADGSASRLRVRAGLGRWSHEYGYGALWTVGHTTAVRGELRQVVRGTRDLVGLLPLGEGRCNFFFSVRLADYDRIRDRGLPAWREHVVSLFPEAEEVIAQVSDFDDLGLTSYRHAVTRTPAEGSLVLIGDAAHPMSPHLGQGANLALIDAWVLARCFAQASSCESALAAYHRARRRQLRNYGAVTMALSPFFQSRGRLLGIGRDVALPLMTRVPPLRRRMVKTMAGLSWPAL